MQSESRDFTGWIEKLRNVTDPSCMDIVRPQVDEADEPTEGDLSAVDSFQTQMQMIRAIEGHILSESASIVRAVVDEQSVGFQKNEIDYLDIWSNDVNFISIISYFEHLSPQIRERLSELKSRYLSEIESNLTITDVPKALIKGENVARRYTKYLEHELTIKRPALMSLVQFRDLLDCAVLHNSAAFIAIALEKTTFSAKYKRLLSDRSLLRSPKVSSDENDK